MKKFNLGFLALALSLVCFATAQAGTVRFTGDVGLLSPGATGGVLNVVFDLDAEDSFNNGGILLDVGLGTPGVIRFTEATIVGGSWSVQNASETDNLASFFTISVAIPPAAPGGFPLGAQNAVFANINYEVIGAGATAITFGVVPEALVDGRNLGTDVTPNYTFIPNVVTVGGDIIPEPATLAMAGMCLIGLAFRRRNG